MKGTGKRTKLLIGILVATIVLMGLVGYRRATAHTITVGFIYDNDETTPYSYNFYLAQKALQESYGDRVRAVMASNVLESEIDEPVKRMADAGCDIIFTDSYGDFSTMAKHYPTIEFCQASNEVSYPSEQIANFHTFKGEIYQGRYVSGIVAGLKLQDMIERGVVNPQEAKVGFVAAHPYREVISGFTAFILGVRTIVPQATLHVKYTNVWSSYTIEKACATELLEEGCAIISQHSDTKGPAVACEEFYAREAYHVGYNIDMTDVAPNTSLTSTRINWTPYVLGAVRSIMDGTPIEETVPGTVHAHNDMSAGFEHGWVELTNLNTSILPHNTQELVNQTIEGLEDGHIQVFSGDYRGVNPNDESDTIDLRKGYEENEQSSTPSFHYLLQGIVEVEE